MALYMVVFFFILMLFGVPVAYALGFSAIIDLMNENVSFLVSVPQRFWSGSDSFVMIALPLFVLAGELMNRGGITDRIIKFAMCIVRPLRGGIGEVNVVASMIFGGISGSSVADTSALGSILIPQMTKKGYSKKFSAGVTVASSTIGIIIPPSIPMLLYASISNESVGKLFLAGVIPGLMIGIFQMVYVWIVSERRGWHPERTKFDLGYFWKSCKDGILALIMPVMIVLCVSLGIATATESAAIAVLYAFLLGKFVYKELNVRELPEILKRTAVSTATIMIIIGFANIFTWVLTINQVPAMIGSFVDGLTMSPWMILVLIDIVILLVGTFIDVAPAIMLLVPILLPIMAKLGVNGLQLGAITIVGLAIGLVTPPVGMCLNACAKITKESLGEIFSGALPFLICNVIVLIMITLIPELTLTLPALLMG